LTLTPNIFTESELPMGHLIPITRTNRLLRLSRESLNYRFYCCLLRVRLSDAAGQMLAD
jgi:hypothetical protein